MKSFKHRRPLESREQAGTYTHRLELNWGGEHVGEAELVYRNDPFPFYYLFILRIEGKQQGRGFGGALVEQLNNFLDSKGKAGILRNIINHDNPACSIYENRGWQPIEGNESWFIYNPPEHLTPDRIRKAIHGIEDMEKGGYYHD